MKRAPADPPTLASATTAEQSGQSAPLATLSTWQIIAIALICTILGGGITGGVLVYFLRPELPHAPPQITDADTETPQTDDPASASNPEDPLSVAQTSETTPQAAEIDTRTTTDVTQFIPPLGGLQSAPAGGRAAPAQLGPLATDQNPKSDADPDVKPTPPKSPTFGGGTVIPQTKVKPVPRTEDKPVAVASPHQVAQKVFVPIHVIFGSAPLRPNTKDAESVRAAGIVASNIVQKRISKALFSPASNVMFANNTVIAVDNVTLNNNETVSPGAGWQKLGIGKRSLFVKDFILASVEKPYRISFSDMAAAGKFYALPKEVQKQTDRQLSKKKSLQKIDSNEKRRGQWTNWWDVGTETWVPNFPGIRKSSETVRLPRITALSATKDGRIVTIALEATADPKQGKHVHWGFVLFDLQQGKVIGAVRQPNVEFGEVKLREPVARVCLTPDLTTIVALHKNGMVSFWDIQTGKAQQAEFQLKHRYFFDEDNSQLAMAPDGQHFAIAYPNGIEMWDIHQRKRMFQLKMPYDNENATDQLKTAPHGVAFTSNGQDLLASFEGQRRLGDDQPSQPICQVLRWDAASGELELVYELIQAEGTPIMTPNGKFVVSGWKVWDLEKLTTPLHKRAWTDIDGKQLQATFLKAEFASTQSQPLPVSSPAAATVSLQLAPADAEPKQIELPLSQLTLADQIHVVNLLASFHNIKEFPEQDWEPIISKGDAALAQTIPPVQTSPLPPGENPGEDSSERIQTPGDAGSSDSKPGQETDGERTDVERLAVPVAKVLGNAVYIQRAQMVNGRTAASTPSPADALLEPMLLGPWDCRNVLNGAFSIDGRIVLMESRTFGKTNADTVVLDLENGRVIDRVGAKSDPFFLGRWIVTDAGWFYDLSRSRPYMTSQFNPKDRSRTIDYFAITHPDVGVTTVERPKPVPGHVISALSSVNDGKTLAIAKRVINEARQKVSGGILLYDTEKARAITTLIRQAKIGQDRDDGEVTFVAMSPDSQTVISSHKDDKLIIWDAKSGDIRGEATHPAVLSAAFSPDSSLFAVSHDTTVTLWDSNQGIKLATLKPLDPHKSSKVDWCPSLKFSSDDQSLLVTYRDAQSVVRWDTKTFQAIVSYELASAHLSSRDGGPWLHPGGRFVFASWKVWDLEAATPGNPNITRVWTDKVGFRAGSNLTDFQVRAKFVSCDIEEIEDVPLRRDDDGSVTLQDANGQQLTMPIARLLLPDQLHLAYLLKHQQLLNGNP